jgi:hypothetical protein
MRTVYGQNWKSSSAVHQPDVHVPQPATRPILRYLLNLFSERRAPGRSNWPATRGKLGKTASQLENKRDGCDGMNSSLRGQLSTRARDPGHVRGGRIKTGTGLLDCEHSMRALRPPLTRTLDPEQVNVYCVDAQSRC